MPLNDDPNQGPYYRDTLDGNVAHVEPEGESMSVNSFGDFDFSIGDRSATAYYEFYFNRRETMAIGGYRQFFPGEAWEFVPDLPSARVSVDVLERPSFQARRIWYNWGLWGYNDEPYRQWCARNRIVVLGLNGFGKFCSSVTGPTRSGADVDRVGFVRSASVAAIARVMRQPRDTST